VTPSYMLAIADEFERQGLDPAACSLRIGIFGAEPWTDSMRAQIEKRMGLDAIDIYGLSEVMGPGVAQECIETKDGLTVWEDHFYPEIIDPATGGVLPDGEPGELVFTSLSKEALPVVRYRTRDLTRLLPGTARTMRRMGRITGRSDDMLIIRGVNVFPTQIEEILVTEPKLAPHYIIEVKREGALDDMLILVEMRQDLGNQLSAEERTKIERHVQHNVKSYVGVTARVQVVDPGKIERSQGKARRVIDLRAKS
jgi:phenylacetate-CoA ligase